MPEPEVVVETLRHWLGRRHFRHLLDQHVMRLRTWHLDAHCVQLADPAVTHQLRGEARVIVRALVATGLQYAAVLLDRVGDRAPLGDGVRERLLTVDVLASVRSSYRRQGVPVVRRRDADRVDILDREKLAEVLE